MAKVKSEKEINYMAFYDSLTNLPNRRMAKKYLEKSIHISMNNNTHIAVMLIDLDSFKMVNDTVGHDGGDQLLKQLTSSPPINMKGDSYKEITRLPTN